MLSKHQKSALQKAQWLLESIEKTTPPNDAEALRHGAEYLIQRAIHNHEPDNYFTIIKKAEEIAEGKKRIFSNK